MTTGRITVLGECVADAFVADTREAGELGLRVLPGGGPANTAVALARLGTPTRFLGRISTDVFGSLFRTRLASSGVDLSACVTATEPSTLAVADVGADGQAAYSFHAEATADFQWSRGELPVSANGSAACLHTGSLALVRAPGADSVDDFVSRVRADCTVSIDPNVRPLLVPARSYRARMAAWCALADILRLSEDDLRHLHPHESVEAACDRWHDAGAGLVVVTLGERGAVVSVNGQRATVPAPSVDIVDTVGAGDAFTAGFLHHLSHAGLLGGRLVRVDLAAAVAAASFAVEAAALTCTVAGANPPWRHQLRESETIRG
ncbi:MAG: carbohydrate kinase [Streptomycetaceae bacterium]|nr:carbohydrate kinase [Streptomycetaceae bacterium]